ncbi:hypothetical protein OUZ56_023404 [Daphnia magna]|uniref:Ferritin n=1 Tax=Daphnia magna TaxID=35525 RepID=A0ABR0AZA8_9CRUS|nr:hypothetical protein OUZ56_023404 [Daphnia magna]
MATKCRQNYHKDCEALVNQQINIEMNANYKYLAMVAFYDRDDVALKGFSKCFKELGHEKLEYIQKLVNYQHLRGGRVVFSDIGRPPDQEWTSPLSAMECALAMEMKVNQAVLDLNKIAVDRNDDHLSDFLKKHFLVKRVETINQLANHHTKINRVGDGLGIFLYDKDLLS